ncbi:MAG: NUDIX domain-containing protein [Enhydrobacter sp.]|nr:MAG: NUDIX domain-containing protein [Enhydrobacter sp.]
MADPDPSQETFELVRQEVAFRGYFGINRYFFRHSLFQGGVSGIISREVFERGQAGAVMPYDPLRDEVVLIRQFRAGSYVAGRHPWEWEVAAGIIEEGETAALMVKREAKEETGLDIGEIESICNVMLSPGAMSESCHIFVGRTDTSRAGGIFGVPTEGENILVRVLPFVDAMAMIERREIGNAVAVIALQWLALHRDEIRRRWR